MKTTGTYFRYLVWVVAAGAMSVGITCSLEVGHLNPGPEPIGILALVLPPPPVWKLQA